MQNKLACADFAFPLLDHEGVFELIKLLEVEGIDIGLFSGRSHLQPEDVMDNLPRSARELSDGVRGRGLEIADIFFQGGTGFQELAPNHPEEGQRGKARDLFSRMLEFTVACNAPHMSGLPGVPWEDESESDSLKRCAEELVWRVEQANAAGVIFSVEAHIGSIVSTPQAALELVRMTPGLTLTLDYTHFTKEGMPDSAVEPLVAHASHFHVRGAREGRLQAPFNENTVDYGRVMEAMDETHYQGFLGLEYVWIDWEHCNECDNLSETIRFRDFLRDRMR